MANPEHIEILKRGVKAWNKWRKENPEIKPDLSGIVIKKVLPEQVYSFVSLKGNKIIALGVILEEIDFSHTNLEKANLRGANLRGANLRGANLEGANLERANLERANLERANINKTNLSYVNMEKAKIYNVSYKKEPNCIGVRGYESDTISAFFKKIIKDQNFLREFKIKNPRAYGL